MLCSTLCPHRIFPDTVQNATRALSANTKSEEAMRHEQLERMQTQLLDVQDTLAGKADITMVNECLALKANKESVASALHRKVHAQHCPTFCTGSCVTDLPRAAPN